MTVAETLAPCGPECRHATPLPNRNGEWVWCALRGEPRTTGWEAAECRRFSPRAQVSEGFAASHFADSPPVRALP